MFHLRTREVQQLLHNKFVVIMGDSVQRAVYKDLVLLLQKDCLLSPRQLKARGELSFEQDVLLEGGRRGRMHNGTHYREVRQFCSGHHLVRFYFLTRVYSQYVVEVLEELRRGTHQPDLVIMNSCLWDLPRYGRDFRRGYCENLKSLFGLMDEVLSVSCLLVWNTAMPVAEVVSGGFLPEEYEHQSAHLREDVIEANFYSAAEAIKHGFDVLDLHFHFRHAGQHRQRDGVHWDERAHRHISQLLLAHVAHAWGVDLPCRYPVGRWLRGDTASGNRGRARGRQDGNRRGDPGERASSSRQHRSTRFYSPQQSSAPYPRAPPLFPTYDQGSCVPAQPPVQQRPVSTDPAAPRGGRPGEANFRSGRERRQGPIRRASSYRQSREFPPYQPCNPNRPRRQRRRHADPRSQERRGFRSQSRT